MFKKDFKFIISIFLSWRIILFVFLFLGLYFLPHSQNFLGGGIDNYLRNPYLWAWANFDGEHYLSIAQWGYKPLQYFFFPVFPLIVRLLNQMFGSSPRPYLFSGLLLNHLFFFLALYGFWKLVNLDFEESVAKKSLILLLLFPTSFFFICFYNESLFLALIIWSFYLARKGNWLFASILAGIAGATRVIGILLLPALITEWFLQKNKGKKVNILSLLSIILLSPLGLIIYLVYLQARVGDPLEFFHSVSLFGAQRSTGLILLPQVFYRYIFKILPSLNLSNFLTSFPIILEFLTAILFLILSIIGIFRLRFSYWLFLVGGYLIPTLAGSFSSLTRYVIVLFPAFILMGIGINKLNWVARLLIYLLLFILLEISTMLFTRGFWLA
jgi:hypothetical protein